MFMPVRDRLFFVPSFGAGGTPFLAHSGWIGTWEDWQPQLAAVSRSRRAIGYDHRGTGRTGGPAADFSFGALVDDVFDVMDGLGIDRCILGLLERQPGRAGGRRSGPVEVRRSGAYVPGRGRPT